MLRNEIPQLGWNFPDIRNQQILKRYQLSYVVKRKKRA